MMAQLTWLRGNASDGALEEKPVLDLSGPLLSDAFQGLAAGAEQHGGVERYVEALKLKAALFRDVLADGRAADLDLHGFMTLCAFMATVRRRISPYLGGDGFANIKQGIEELLSGVTDTSTADFRIAAFCERFPDDGAHRFVRDLAGEILHNFDPERYPLMNRWVWDAKANTGAVREIWFGDNIDHMTIPLADGYATFLGLREELTQFLTSEGVYCDVVFFADLLIAQVYANYISAQGGTYLRADFSSAEDPMHHTRRILGLDGLRRGSNRTWLKAVDGQAFVLDDVKMLS